MKPIGETLAEGSLGFFWMVESWPPALDDADVERGWLQLRDQSVDLRLLNEIAAFGQAISFGNQLDIPAAVVGVLPDGGVMLLECGPRFETRAFGGQRASTTRIDARTVVGGLTPAELASPKLFEIALQYQGLQAWAGVSTVRQSVERRDGLANRWSAETVSVDPVSTSIGSIRLHINAGWQVSPGIDQIQIQTPLTVRCAAKRPRPVAELVEPLSYIQDLISLAHGGLSVPVKGTCLPHTTTAADPRHPRPTFWSGLLHPDRDQHLPTPKLREPYFMLADIGGIDGLSRWVRLCRSHYRAVAPTLQHMRLGLPTAPGLLKEVAVAIEYWTAANKGGSWSNTKDFTGSVISCAGRPAFDAWCGNSGRWKDAFWNHYNMMKHNPTFAWDDEELADLAVSGRLVLTAALLNTVARSHRPSRVLFAGLQHRRLGDRLKRRYG